MQIGQVIRKYRKSKSLTQEEMAKCLGVSAPAVNKWENGNSYPDITLLAPIARLLDITLDTLLTFHEELTAEEINRMVCEADKRLKTESFEEVFQWAKQKIEQYPSCGQLLWQMAVVLDAWHMAREIPDAARYDPMICEWYIRALSSKDEKVRSSAADALFGYYMRKEQYGRAEECLEYLSSQNPERKRKQAEVYSKTNRVQEAYKAYEELLFADYQMVSAALQGLYRLAVQEKDRKKAHMLTEKQQKLASLFEMGRYYEVFCKMDLAVLEKDVETTIQTMEEMLSSIDELSKFTRSPLYEHMKFRELADGFVANMKHNIIQCFRDEESYGFLEKDKRWKELLNRESY